MGSKVRFLFLLLFTGQHISLAQPKQVSYQNLQWFQYYQNLEWNEQWSLRTDGGFRWQEGLSEKSQFLIRPAIAYSLGPNIRLSVGVAYLGFFSGDTLSRTEIRPHQEASFKQSFGKLSVSHRIRIEQRNFFFQDERLSSTFNHRFRYRLWLTYPLFHLHQERRINFHLGDEVLINSGKEIIYNTLDQNRILVGPSCQLSPALSVSLIYHHMFSVRNEPNSFRQNYILWVGLRHRLRVNKGKTGNDI